MPKKIKLTPSVCLVLSSFLLNGCAAPPALQILSFALDGISYLATDKTVADHGLSVVAQKDCKMLRTLQGEDICYTESEESVEEIIEKVMTEPAEPIAPAE